MSEPTFEQLRIPAALILIITVAFIFLPRSGDEEPTATTGAPAARSSPTAGQPGGAVTATVPPTPLATLTPPPTSTPKPTATPVADSGFAAEVLACRVIAGPSCIGQFGVIPARAGTFTALVRFSAANAGDAMGVIARRAGWHDRRQPLHPAGRRRWLLLLDLQHRGAADGRIHPRRHTQRDRGRPDLVSAWPLSLSLRPTTRSPRRGARCECRPLRAAGPPMR